jgi:hypothetical protein
VKKVMWDRVYDTEKANVVFTYENSYRGQLDWYVETYYITDNRNWFVHGKGNVGKYPAGPDMKALAPEQALRELSSLYGQANVNADVLSEILLEYFMIEEA